jgi:hypothetical protein
MGDARIRKNPDSGQANSNAVAIAEPGEIGNRAARRRFSSLAGVGLLRR